MLWVDHYSKYLFGHLQETATIKETLLSKEAFETFATHYNVQVCHICSDNGVFASANIAKHIKACGQCHSVCGVSAHWQNGIIEQYIGIITNHARTMLLHAMSAWPNVITAEFWTFAFMHAIHLHNHKPNPT